MKRSISLLLTILAAVSFNCEKVSSGPFIYMGYEIENKKDVGKVSEIRTMRARFKSVEGSQELIVEDLAEDGLGEKDRDSFPIENIIKMRCNKDSTFTAKSYPITKGVDLSGYFSKKTLDYLARRYLEEVHQKDYNRLEI